MMTLEADATLARQAEHWRQGLLAAEGLYGRWAQALAPYAATANAAPRQRRPGGAAWPEHTRRRRPYAPVLVRPDGAQQTLPAVAQSPQGLRVHLPQAVAQNLLNQNGLVGVLLPETQRYLEETLA